MVDPVGEDGLCWGLPVGLWGWHAGKTIYTNGGGDAGHRGGADAWGSAATCIQGTHGQRQKQTVVISPCQKQVVCVGVCLGVGGRLVGQ